MTGLSAAQDAFDQGDWQAALDALASLDPLPAEALDLRAMALYAAGDFDGAIATWEQLHVRRSASGERTDAARAAVMVAMFLLMDSGLLAPVRGWLRRGRALLENEPLGPVHAWAAAVHGYERFFSGDLETARAACVEAIALGEEHGVAAAVALGRTLEARLLLVDGEIEAGLRALDDVGAFLMSGEVDPLTVGMMLCEIVCAAQSLAMPERAREWTDVMHRWGHGSAIGSVAGRCRVHRAELLRISGPCDAAEEEALAACDLLRPWMRREFGWPLVELGNARLRKGDLDGAEESFLAAASLSWSPQPGLALLKLARGDTAAATALIADAIRTPPDLPWKERPPTGDLQLTPFLEAQAEIAEAAGDVETCTSAASRLAAISQRYPSRGLVAAAQLAQARAELLTGNLDAARGSAMAAAAVWSELGAPFDAAVARVVAGDAAAKAGHTATAELDRKAAQRAFSNFGAIGRAQAVADRLTTSTVPASSRPLRAVFRRDGELRIVVFADKQFDVPDLVGFRYLGRLLESPGVEMAATDLVAAERGTVGDTPPQSGLPAIDQQAREAYRRRLSEVDDDIAEAEAMNDLARVELARRDRDFLIAELSNAVGLSGRIRQVGGDAERARTSVFRAMRYAIDRLGEHDSTLADHLRRATRTGTWCSYEPDPLAPIDWTT